VLTSLFTRDNQDESLSQQCARMIEEQLRGRGIHDERALAAMARVPREKFVSAEDADKAYADGPLPIGAGQTVSQPYMVAAMLEKLELQPSDRVLEVGTGTGYQAAILGELAAEVWSIERHSELAEKAQTILKDLGYVNVHVIHGDGSLGLADQSPFDKILVAAAAPHIPDALIEQLAEDGRLVLPVGPRHEQQLQLVRRVQNELSITTHTVCRFVPLVGEQGWQS
jgi:protein-L-isoaspartate(D-aspartate) O-methyltransferase